LDLGLSDPSSIGVDTTRFARYRILRKEDGRPFELGRGAMGVTYKAHDERLRIDIALKIINAIWRDDPSVQALFLREARAAARVRHPNVASVFFLNDEPENFFYAMEFVEGESMREWMKGRTPLHPLLAISLAEQIAGGLHAIHTEQIVHRDLKPSNIMIIRTPKGKQAEASDLDAETWSPKIVDFGLARFYRVHGPTGESEPETVGFRGTALYASPEQCEERPDIDGRSDLYSLGCVLWEMLVGTPPFMPNIHRELLSAHVAKPPPLAQLSHLPPSAQAVIARLLMKDREARFSNAGAVIDALKKCRKELARGETVSATEVSTIFGALPSSAPSIPKKSIAVLPFANMSGDPEQEYFSDGITEDIITDLSKISALTVAARNTAFLFKGKPVDVQQVARQLKVSHVLEGSVRKAGVRLRITAQLVEGTSGSHVWAERYDRNLDDIFALQDEISDAVVAALKLKLLPEEKKSIERRGSGSAEAYDLFLMARQYYVGGNVGDVREGETIIRLCRRATEIDPSYAGAWALMGWAQRHLFAFHWKVDDDGLLATKRALALDANLAEAHAIKALICEEAGRHEEAFDEITAALRLDPDSYEVNRSAAYYCFRQHRLDDAIYYFEKASNLMETDFSSPSMLITCFTAKRDSASARNAAQVALARIEKVLAQHPNNGSAMGYGALALGSLGDAPRTKQWIDRALLIDPDNLGMRYNFACALSAHLNDVDGALGLLGPYLSKCTQHQVEDACIDPDLEILQNHPHFQEMLAAAKARFAQGQGPA
jgi:adenylate cyclase